MQTVKEQNVPEFLFRPQTGPDRASRDPKENGTAGNLAEELPVSE